MNQQLTNFNGHEISKDAEGRISPTDPARDPAGFTGMAVLKDGKILVDDVVDVNAWRYFCDHVLFSGADEGLPGIGLAGVFMRGIQAIQEEQRSADIKEAARQQPGYLYFMVDSRNGFIKIGLSKDAEARESTLQSQAPSIKLLAKVRLKRKADTFKLEKHLHAIFRGRRQRGEWFDLSAHDYEYALRLAQEQATEINAAYPNE